jgi:Fe-S cluster biogenesis protein NfuA
MSGFKIIGESENGNDWALFKLNKSINLSSEKKFNNVEEAIDAPLVKQLFYLPFVKCVIINKSNIKIQRFNILEWNEVIQEVSKQIEDYLNNGGVILNDKKNEKIPINIYAESTPNPAVMKFVANKPLVSSTFEYKNIDQAKDSPLAQKLFHYPYVKEIFMDHNYISITKYEISQWDEVILELKEFIKNYIQDAKVIVNENSSKINLISSVNTKELNLIETQIIKILDQYVKPAVASDGGNIAFEKYDPKKKTLKVVLQGACSGCPSSTFTLKNGIENILKEMIPGIVNKVEAING